MAPGLLTPSHPLCGLRNEQRPGGPRPPALDVSRTSRELADDAHGDVGAGPRAPQPAAALDPVAAVVAQHAGAQAWGPPVGVVHSCVVLPDQGAPCGKGGIGGGIVGDGGQRHGAEADGREEPCSRKPPHPTDPHPPPTGPHPPCPHPSPPAKRQWRASPCSPRSAPPDPIPRGPTFGVEVHAQPGAPTLALRALQMLPDKHVLHLIQDGQDRAARWT